jgi:16S rRNA (guanine527-N7)-methyltransferase
MPPRGMIERLSAAAGRDVSRETFGRVGAYVAHLKDAAARQNLIAPSTLDIIWERHILDSAQLVRFEPRAGASWVDIGSGAGLPGVVIALLVEGPVTLVEPRRLRAEFLREAVAALGISKRVTVEAARAERIVGHFDVITARAVAALAQFLEMSQHLSTRNTIWVLPKGRSAQAELAEARRTWQGAFRLEPSVTGDDSYIIVGSGVGKKR